MTNYETGLLIGFLAGWMAGGFGAILMLGLCRTAADDREDDNRC